MEQEKNTYDYVFYFTFFAGLVGTVVFLKKPLQRLLIKTISSSIDLFYDIKYRYYVDLPEVSDDSKIERQVRAPVIHVDPRGNYLIYKWSDGKYYMTTACVLPFLPNNNEAHTIDSDDDDMDACECSLIVNGTSRSANEREKALIRTLAGPGQDFSVSMRPLLTELRAILNLPGLDKVIFNNSNYEEFIFR